MKSKIERQRKLDDLKREIDMVKFNKYTRLFSTFRLFYVVVYCV